MDNVSRIKPRKTGPIAGLEDKLDGLVRRLIWNRDGGYCQRCMMPAGDTGEVAHVHGRGLGKSLRWALQNCILLCFDCHRQWAHRYIKAFANWFSSLYPDRWKYIQDHRNDIWKPTPDELKAMVEQYEQKLAEVSKCGF